jgi:hypothetical protein
MSQPFRWASKSGLFLWLGIERRYMENAYEKFTKREWAMALVGLTPGGSEFLTPDECVHYVRRSREFPRTIIELRAQNAQLRRLVEQALDRHDDGGTWGDTLRAALAIEPR